MAVFAIEILPALPRELCIGGADRKGVRALAAEPGVEEGDAIRLVIFSTRLPVKGEGLAVALGDDAAVGAGVQQVAYGEVIELQSYAPKQSARSPADNSIWSLALETRL